MERPNSAEAKAASAVCLRPLLCVCALRCVSAPSAVWLRPLLCGCALCCVAAPSAVCLILRIVAWALRIAQ